MPDKKLVKELKVRLPDKFSEDLLNGAPTALTQDNVATSAQHLLVYRQQLKACVHTYS
jgi:hypothetical protein